MRVALTLACLLGCGRIGFDAEADAASSDAASSDAPRCRALDPSWTPQWSSVIAYEPFDGNGAISSGDAIPAVVGQDGSAGVLAGSTMAYVPGKVAQAIQFDGVGDVVTVPLPTIDQTSGHVVSVALWMNWNGQLYAGNSGNWTKVFLFTNPEYSFTFVAKGSSAVLGYNTGHGDLWGVPTVGLADTWVHVVAVLHNGESNLSELYLDGQLAAMTQEEGSANTSNVGTSMMVAAYPSYPSYLAATLDELAVWNAELTAADVHTLYAAQADCP
jgi:hypothetical protein